MKDVSKILGGRFINNTKILRQLGLETSGNSPLDFSKVRVENASPFEETSNVSPYESYIAELVSVYKDVSMMAPKGMVPQFTDADLNPEDLVAAGKPAYPNCYNANVIDDVS